MDFIKYNFAIKHPYVALTKEEMVSNFDKKLHKFYIFYKIIQYKFKYKFNDKINKISVKIRKCP